MQKRRIYDYISATDTESGIYYKKTQFLHALEDIAINNNNGKIIDMGYGNSDAGVVLLFDDIIKAKEIFPRLEPYLKYIDIGTWLTYVTYIDKTRSGHPKKWEYDMLTKEIQAVDPDIIYYLSDDINPDINDLLQDENGKPMIKTVLKKQLVPNDDVNFLKTYWLFRYIITYTNKEEEE